jgi:vitamin B12 transporter
MSLLLLLAAQAVPPADAEPGPEILVTASRSPVEAENAAVSSTVMDEARIEAIGALQTTDLLRLSPGISVSTSGARGTLAEVRVRGSETNHSLLFVDGIRLNDPAAGNQPRFEILSADGLGRVEIIRGPQSALWGSEALGGVIALESPVPRVGTRVAATGEYGSNDTLRGSAWAGHGSSNAGLSLQAAHMSSDGIDIVGGGAGDRDGFQTSTLAGRAAFRPSADSEIGIVGRYIDHRSEFDGLDPISFQRADTADNSKTETGAARVYVKLGTRPDGPWAATFDAQYIDSSNRNFNGDAPLNRTSGNRLRFSGQVEHRLKLGGARHVLIAAAEREEEDFTARDQQFFGGTDQDRSRGRSAIIGEWRADWGARIGTDIAIRHDDFTRFADATTFRAAAQAQLGGGFSFSGSYGEGIAQPTFLDLFGFFPGSFVGNPALWPESSKGWEARLAWRGKRASASITGFGARLRDEIVGTSDPITFISSTTNATGRSSRRGVELEGTLEPKPGLRLSANYTYLKASDQQVAGGMVLRETRRPKHSANLAFDWVSGPLTMGGYLAYVGKRQDGDFDFFPAPTVTLDDYLLASLRAGFELSDGIELFGRIENGFDADYQDVFGYATPGRTVHAGLRFRFGD